MYTISSPCCKRCVPHVWRNAWMEIPGILVFFLSCFIKRSMYEALTLPPALPINSDWHFCCFTSCILVVARYFFSQVIALGIIGSILCLLPLPCLMITCLLCRSISVVFSWINSLILIAVAYDNSTMQRFCMPYKSLVFIAWMILCTCCFVRDLLILLSWYFTFIPYSGDCRSSLLSMHQLKNDFMLKYAIIWVWLALFLKLLV